jgi:hypothetical protein
MNAIANTLIECHIGFDQAYLSSGGKAQMIPQSAKIVYHEYKDVLAYPRSRMHGRCEGTIVQFDRRALETTPDARVLRHIRRMEV